MPKVPRYCRDCGAEVRWKGYHWIRVDGKDIPCTDARGHHPNNNIRPDQLKGLKRKT